MNKMKGKKLNKDNFKIKEVRILFSLTFDNNASAIFILVLILNASATFTSS